MPYLVTFLEGLGSFISPCVLPLLPLYLGYFAGETEADGKKTRFVRSLFFVFGFSAVFCLLGVLAGSLGTALSAHRRAVDAVCGVLMVLFGLSIAGLVPLRFFKGLEKAPEITGRFSAFLFGLVFALSLSPCVGAYLASALLLAASEGGAVKGLSLLLVYALGLGLPFILSALLLDALSSVFAAVKRHYRVLNLVCGMFLVAIGILMLIGKAGFLSPARPNVRPEPISTEYAAESTDAAESTSESRAPEQAALPEAPDFTLLDRDGNPTSFRAQSGMPVVINFWATWCGPCASELPFFEQAAKTYEGRVRFMMVNLTNKQPDTIASVRSFMAKNGYAFPVYFDTEEQGAAAYGISAIPLTVFITAEGRILDSHIGSMDEETLLSYLNKLAP